MNREDALRATREYYQENARAFDARTAQRDLTREYSSFLAGVPPGGRILDAGCGAGRDAAAFARTGYRVTAVDGSPAMVALASERLGLPALLMTFDQIDYDAEFDGVWACASLLHVPRSDMSAVLARLRRALKPGGVLYASFKRGQGEEFREERWFNDYEEEALAALFTPDAWSQVRIWPSEEVRPGKVVAWLNALGRRSAD